jgi:hypothetical protein
MQLDVQQRIDDLTGRLDMVRRRLAHVCELKGIVKVFHTGVFFNRASEALTLRWECSHLDHRSGAP